MRNTKAMAKNAGVMLIFGVAALLAACGGGSSSSVSLAVVPIAPLNSAVDLSGATRIVASTRYDYTATSVNFNALSNVWTWGDGTSDTTAAAQINKVWYTPGNYDIALAATARNVDVGSNRLATVIGTPVTSAADHTCAIRFDNTVVCWGSNTYGQLGDGTQTDSAVPVLVKGISQAIALSSNGNQTCAVLADNTVWCWGGSFDPAFPTVITKLPKQVVGLNDVVTVVSGSFHHCVLKKDGTVWCWGYDGAPVFGNGPASVTETQRPVKVAAVAGAIAIGAGDQHMCAIVGARRLVQCWGNNDFGQTSGTTVSNLSGRLPLETETPIAVPGVSSAVSLSVIAATSCAVMADGSMKCWGDNARGQFATGNAVGKGLLPPSNFKPQVVTTPITKIAAVAQGYNTCALKTDKTVACWGDYQPIAGAHTAAVETTVAQLGNDNAFVSSGATTCALKTDGRLFCRGVNDVGQLGNGSFIDSPLIFAEVLLNTMQFEPTSLRTLASGFDNNCAVTANRGVACWDVGNGASAATAVIKAGLTNVKSVVVSRLLISLTTGCALTFAGDVLCWRGNLAPTLVSNLTDVKAIAGGDGDHNCAVKNSGEVYCWGSNYYGQLGVPLTTPSSTAAIQVPGLFGAVDVAVGGVHSCATKNTGRVVCWGYGLEGQLGDGMNTSSILPVRIGGAALYLSSASMSNSDCAISVTRSLWCWGTGVSGQLATGDATSSSVPRIAAVVSDVWQHSIGFFHSCVVNGQREMFCSGNGTYGQLGQGTFTSSRSFLKVDDATGFIEVAAGARTTCGKKLGGDIYCWGTNLVSGTGAIASGAPILKKVIGVTGGNPPVLTFWR